MPELLLCVEISRCTERLNDFCFEDKTCSDIILVVGVFVAVIITALCSTILVNHRITDATSLRIGEQSFELKAVLLAGGSFSP